MEQLEPGGMALVTGASRFWVNWPLLGLSDVKTSATGANLRWRVHCIDPDSRPGDYHAGWQNSCNLRVTRNSSIVPASVHLRTGVLELDFQLESWHTSLASFVGGYCNFMTYCILLHLILYKSPQSFPMVW